MPRWFLTIFAIFFPSIGVVLAEAPKATIETNSTKSSTELDAAIFAEIDKNSKLMKNLEYLCDRIGPRLTGSAKLEKANEWAAAKMKEYGLTSVQLEPYEIPVGWERGKATFTMIEPNAGKSFAVASAGWTPGTKGKIAGEVAFVDAKTKDDLAKYKGKLKGKIVLRSAPADVKPITDLTYLSPKPTEPKDGDPKKPNEKPESSIADAMAFQKALAEFVKEEGAAVVLRDSAKPHGLLSMTGSWPKPERDGDRPALDPLPTLFVAHENYLMLHRLTTATDAQPPKVEVEITNTFVPGPIAVYNTVGEVRGREKPDEFVVVGAHLDSWDLGTGATDNGTGSCAVLEVARTIAALAKAGHPPKRTIRFVLFSGEEQGLYGSKAYVKSHRDEMPKTSCALVHDTGTGFVHGFGLQGREAVKAVLESELEGLKEAKGFQGLTLRSLGGTDHLSFEAAEVPGFACDQDIDEYRLTHHTQTDTFDHVKEPNMIQGAKVLAVAAYRIANLPELLPREKPKKDEKKP